MIADNGKGETHSVISGGVQYGPVLQGRDFHNIVFVTNHAAAAPVALAQLPAPVTGFIGRETELRQVTALLKPTGDAATVVVSAVAGLAGVGKTALTIQAAHAAHNVGWFPGGVLFIDLHGYDETPVEPGQALDALLRALGFPSEHVPPGTEERAGLYRSMLAEIDDPVLVVIDNASSEAQVRLLLPGLGPHRVIVTSRNTLAGLGARLLDVAVLDDQAGMALLDGVLRSARPHDDRISSNPQSASGLAEICGGLPLALRIIAAFLIADPSLTVRGLREELADDIHRLKALHYDDGNGTSSPSVAAAFELSYQQLDETTARMFRLLSVNPGPDISTAAAAALADRPTSEARKVISHLAKAHLIEVGTSAGRWRMHDLLRLYAGQLSDTNADTDRREEARNRLLDYYLNSTHAANAHLGALPDTPVPVDFTDRDSALVWLDAERPNLIAAVTMATSTGRDQIAMQLPLLLSDYLAWRRRLDDWLAVITIGKDTARRLNDRSKETAALNDLGRVLMEVRRFDEAITAFRSEAAICRDSGDRPGEAGALNNLGNVLQEVNRFDEAITVLQDAAEMYRASGDRHGEGMALGNLGSALVEVRRFDEAIAAYEEDLVIRRESDDRHGEGTMLDNLGLALRKVRRFDEAITDHQDAVSIFRETGDEHSEARALNNLGIALREVRRFDEAITVHKHAMTIYREFGDRHREGRALNSLGRTLVEVSRFDEAFIALQDAEAIFREFSDRYNESMVLDNLGRALVGVRRFDEAIAAHQDAAAIYKEFGDRHGEGMTLDNLGHALREVSRFDEAIAAHQNAVTIFRETGDPYGESMALLSLELDRAAQEM